MKTSKTTLFLLIAIVLSLALGACQGGTPTVSKDDTYGDLEELDPRGTVVIYWHALTGADEDRLLEIIDDFNASNEWNIAVIGEYQGDLETLYARVIADLPSDKIPDMVMTDPGLAAAYAAQGTAMALSPYLESKKWGFTPTERDDFFPSALESEGLPQFQGQGFSFPTCRSLQVLYYNTDRLKELGYDAPPQTWDEFREIACAASNPADGLYGYEVATDSSLFTSLLATQDAPLLNRNATAYTLGGRQGRASLQLLQDLIQEGCATWETEEGPLLNFGAGKVLFTIGPTAELPTYHRLITEGANFDWGLSSLPHTTEEAVIGVQGVSLTILRSTPRKQLAAWLFIKWLAEPEQQAHWAQEAACFPTRRSALATMDDYLAEHPYYNLAAQLLENEWVAEPGVTAYAACRAGIERMLYGVTAGESVDQWLADTRAHCNQALIEAAP